MTLSESRILNQNLDFRGLQLKFGHFKAINNAQTTSEHPQNNFQKVQKTGFLTLKMVKMTLPEGQILTENFDFRGHISTFRAKNTPKNRHFFQNR